MCWRDAYMPPSLEGLQWAARWRTATTVRVGDAFSFGPMFDDGDPKTPTVFHRVFKPGDDEVGKTAPNFLNPTKVRFTEGDFAGQDAILVPSQKRYWSHFRLTDGRDYYPFQKRTGFPPPDKIKFEVLEVPVRAAR